MKARINLDELPLERQDDLKQIPGTDVTETAPFNTADYDLYRPLLSGEMQDNRRCERRNRQETVAEPPPMQYE